MTSVKICGLTREGDVAAACDLGAAILGFNFVESSPRRLQAGRAAELSAAAPAGVLRAGVFNDEDRDRIARVVREAGLDIVQLHRRVRSEDLDTIPASVVAAIPLEAGYAGLPPREVLSRCRSILWDSSGGRGKAPDWSLLEGAASLPVPVFVAGGLTAQNVGEVIRRLRPAGVDVASGVESAPGVKDRRKLELFFAAVREADRA